MPDFSPWSLVGGAAIALGSAWIGSQFSQRNMVSQWLRDKRLGCFIEITKATSELVVEAGQFGDDPKKASIEKYKASLQKLRDACDTLFWVGTIDLNKSVWKICDYFGVRLIEFLDFEEHEEQVWEKLMSELNELQSSFDYHARGILNTNQDKWKKLTFAYITNQYKRLRYPSR